MSIEEKEIFASTLERVYWIEVEMENLGIWEARIEMMGDGKESLGILAHDSDRHRFTLEKWMKKANIDIPEKMPLGLPDKKFDFSAMDSPEIFKELMKYEILIKDIYRDMITTDSAILDDIFPDEREKADFLSDIENIIEDEERHENICRQQVGGFQTIISQRK